MKRPHGRPASSQPTAEIHQMQLNARPELPAAFLAAREQRTEKLVRALRRVIIDFHNAGALPDSEIPLCAMIVLAESIGSMPQREVRQFLVDQVQANLQDLWPTVITGLATAPITT